MALTLSAQSIVKRYAGVVALAQGDLKAQSGEVVALIGANGSGKSTLCKIITGVVAPEGGQLLLGNDPASFRTPYEAQAHGIAAVYQDLSLIPTMSVADNVWLNHEPLSGGILLDRPQIRSHTQALIDLFAGAVHASLTPDALVSSLPPDERQIVEILKALSVQPQIMILDEATSSLDSRQVARLFDLIADWKAQGKAIIYISHRMGEIMRIADRVTVLRNGRTVSECAVAEVTEKDLVSLMVGKDQPQHAAGSVAAEPSVGGEAVLLHVQDLRTQFVKGVSFQVQRGELLGIGGLQGQGQADVLLALFGAIPYAGAVLVGDKPCHFRHPSQAMARGIAFVPGDRATEGLLLRSSIFDNLLLPDWGKYGFPLRIGRARESAKVMAESLNVVMDTLDMPVSSLSGGNAQKIVLGKWLQRNPGLLLLNDPTKGVDVGAKAEFYALLAQLQAQGTAIVLYSSDDEELVGLCDRVLVMYDGHVRTELRGLQLTLPNLVAASLSTSEEVG